MSRVARFGWFVLVFNVGVILFGAFVRATGSGAGCGPSWPTCQPSIGGTGDTERLIELTHRLTAGLALVLVGLLAVWVWRSTDKGHPARTGAVLSAIAVVGEALIGAMIVLAEWVADDTSVARAISVPLHLINTLFLLAALTLTIFWLGGGSRLSFSRDRTVGRTVLLGGLALVLLAATGAVTALADTLFPKTTEELVEVEHFLTRLRVVHPVLAMIVVAIGWWVSARSGHLRTMAARSIFWLVAAMMLTGAVNVALGVPVWMQLVHLGLADALWISYVWVAAQSLQDSAATESRLSPSR